VRVSFSPAGMLTPYFWVVKFLRTWGSSDWVVSEPPTIRTWMASVSWLWTSRTARVGWPLTSLTPKTSAWGKEVEMSTLRLGVFCWRGSSMASLTPLTCSTCNWC
jgi:hypothetical protein